jgi:hypothetical protein
MLKLTLLLEFVNLFDKNVNLSEKNIYFRKKTMLKKKFNATVISEFCDVLSFKKHQRAL